MGGFFGVASREDCTLELFYGVDYHSHLGTRRGGMATYGANGFSRAIHNIENSPFRTKFERDVAEMEGHLGIGCISDYEPQPLLIQSHLGSFAITTVGQAPGECLWKRTDAFPGNEHRTDQCHRAGSISDLQRKNDYGRYSSSAGCGGWLHDAAFDDERRNLRRP